jgi:hypothetical protein
METAARALPGAFRRSGGPSQEPVRSAPSPTAACRSPVSACEISTGSGISVRKRACMPATPRAGLGFVAMAARDAACSCGQLRLEAAGDPIRISMCHCLACQRRTGSAFSIQARFTSDQVHVVGRFSDYVRVSDQGDKELTFHFCPDCGATVFFTGSDAPDVIAVPVGAFADPSFPPPTVSVFESRRHPWVAVPAAIERHD